MLTKLGKDHQPFLISFLMVFLQYTKALYIKIRAHRQTVEVNCPVGDAYLQAQLNARPGFLIHVNMSYSIYVDLMDPHCICAFFKHGVNLTLIFLPISSLLKLLQACLTSCLVHLPLRTPLVPSCS